MKAWGEGQNPKKRGAWTVGGATTVCDICKTYVHSGFGPVVATRAGQADLL